MNRAKRMSAAFDDFKWAPKFHMCSTRNISSFPLFSFDQVSYKMWKHISNIAKKKRSLTCVHFLTTIGAKISHGILAQIFAAWAAKNSPLSNMAECYKRETWGLGTSTLISEEEADFYGGGWLLRRKLTSTEEDVFLRRRLISTEKADFYGRS